MSNSNLPMGPKLFLVNQETIIDVSNKAMIARKKGNLHLKLDPEKMCLECYFEDKFSSDDISSVVTINGVEVMPETTQILSIGEVLKVGNEEFKLFENLEAAQAGIPKRNRRRYKRPKNAYAPINFVNFYSAPPMMLAMYLLALSFPVLYLLFYRLPQAPEHLDFLAEIFTQKRVPHMAIVGLGLWFTSLVHSFSMYIYFNRNTIRRLLASICYVFVVLLIVFFGPRSLGKIPSYLHARQMIHGHRSEATQKTINDLRKLVDAKTDLILSYESIFPELSSEDRQSLEEDFNLTIKQVESMIKLQQ